MAIRVRRRFLQWLQAVDWKHLWLGMAIGEAVMLAGLVIWALYQGAWAA
jgi:hypothetical protein